MQSVCLVLGAAQGMFATANFCDSSYFLCCTTASLKKPAADTCLGYAGGLFVGVRVAQLINDFRLLVTSYKRLCWAQDF